MTTFSDQLEKIKTGPGFLAALDQSGGSTPKALKVYGVDESEYSGDEAMYDCVHAMRTRIVTNEEFRDGRILGAILFENTLNREIGGKPSSQYLWFEKGVVPFLKVDKGLADEADGVQLMKPIPGLSELLKSAKALDVFGTKMRSVINSANPGGVSAIVAQQFEIGQQILDHGLVPIIEPEVNIKSADKAESEQLLKAALLKHLDGVKGDLPVMLKLTLPEEANFYADVIAHPKVLKVVALSGGYSREVANRMLAENAGMIASFSRALSEGLNAKQSDAEFTQLLGQSIETICAASAT